MSDQTSNPTNGQIITRTVDIISIRTIPFDNDAKPDMKGKFGLVVEPHEENERGVMALSESQMMELAQGLSLSRWKTMAPGLAKMDSQLVIQYEYCAAGETSPDNPEVTYGHNWWKRNQMRILPGEAAEKFFDQVALQIATTGEQDAERAADEKARSLRRERIRARLSGNTAKVSADTADDTADTA